MVDYPGVLVSIHNISSAMSWSTSAPCGAVGCYNTGKHQKCGGCKLRSYCSKACQLSDWGRHKIACKRQQQFIKKALAGGAKVRSSQVIDHVKYKRRLLQMDPESIMQFWIQTRDVCVKYKIDPDEFMAWINLKDQNANEPIPVYFKALSEAKQVTLFVDLYAVHDVDIHSQLYADHPQATEMRWCGNNRANMLSRVYFKVLSHSQLKQLDDIMMRDGISDYCRNCKNC